MNFKPILGTILIVGGISLFFLSSYIENEVAYQSERARNKTKMFTQPPVIPQNQATKYGSQIAQKAIEQNVNDQIDEAGRPYHLIAFYAQAGGVILVVVGAILLIFGRSKKD